MKGICHLWSRGRHVSPSLPGDRYLKLGSPQKRPPGRNLGEHRSVRRSGTASRGTVVLAIFLRMRSLLRTKVTIFLGKSMVVTRIDTPKYSETFNLVYKLPTDLSSFTKGLPSSIMV